MVDREALKPFAMVLGNIDFGKLPGLALRMRDRNISGTRERSLTCTVDTENPKFGAYNILFVLSFSDGVKWIIKFPQTGYVDRWDYHKTQSLISESFTMQLLRLKTTVPVPSVFAFDAACENEAGAPYILMEYIQAQHLPDVWFDDTIDAETLKKRRLTTLRDCANAMAQLGRIRFTKGGSPDYDEDGTLVGVCELLIEDMHATLRKQKFAGYAATDSIDGFHAGGEDALPTKLDLAKERRMKKDEQWEQQKEEEDEGEGEAVEDSAVFAAIGPFQDPAAMLLHAWNVCWDTRKTHIREEDTAYERGKDALIRLFVSWIPQEYPGDHNGEAFVLSHPDFDIQNVLVDEDGHLVALIDWDGVCAAPLANGNCRLPNWLTRDWDTMTYSWSSPRSPPSPVPQDGEEDNLLPDDSGSTQAPEQSAGGSQCECPSYENSPEELSFYRASYTKFMREAAGEQAARIARNSLLVYNLVYAFRDPRFVDTRFGGICDKINEVVVVPKAAKKASQAVGNSGEAENTEQQDRKLKPAPLWRRLVMKLLSCFRRPYSGHEQSGDEAEEERDPKDYQTTYIMFDLAEGPIDDPQRLEVLRDAFKIYCS